MKSTVFTWTVMPYKVHLLIAIILCCTWQGFCQVSETDADKLFSAAPVAQRRRLVQRMNLFITLERARKWDESYAMISDTFKLRIGSGFPLENYKREKNIKIRKFVPHSFEMVSKKNLYTAQPLGNQEGHYFMGGCGKFRSDGTPKEVLIEAYWEKGDWYFSFMQVLGFEGGTTCNIKRK